MVVNQIAVIDSKKKNRNHERIGGDKLRIIKKLEKIENSERIFGSKEHRKRKKHSDKFNNMFSFYLRLYRSKLITFCGSKIEVEYCRNSSDGKVSFKEYDNGIFKNTIPKTQHPNILYGVLMGKKGWGLWCDLWCQGIAEGTFTKYEILETLKDNKIDMPESIEKEFNNLIWKYRLKYLN